MTITEADRLQGASVVSAGGNELGAVDAIYVDAETGRPELVGLRTAPSEDRLWLVPLIGAEEEDGALRVPYDRARIQGAPRYPVGRALDAAEEASLYDHYGLDEKRRSGPTGTPVARPAAGAGSSSEERDPASRLRMYWP